MFGRFPVFFSGLHLPNFEAEQVRMIPNQPAFIIMFIASKCFSYERSGPWAPCFKFCLSETFEMYLVCFNV